MASAGLTRFARLMVVVLGVGLGFLVASQSAPGQIQETRTVTITVDDPRPMAAAVDKLEELSGIPINYEDMPVYFSADIKDVTEEVARTPPLGGRRILVARGGKFSVSIVVDAATGKLIGTQSVRAALAKVIAAYNSSGLPGEFKYEFHNGVFFVMPLRYRNANGTTQPWAPILSTLLTFSQETRSTFETARLIQGQLPNPRPPEVIKVMGALTGRFPGVVTLGAQNEPARCVIARFLASSGAVALSPNATWDRGMAFQFYCQPEAGCTLNVHRVGTRHLEVQITR